MTLDDYEAALELWQHSPGIALGESDTRAQIEAFLARNPGLSFVAVQDNRLVGTVLCGQDGRRGYLHHLAVHEAYRRRGIGRQLVQLCLEGLRKQGILKCHIFLEADNREGEIFWVKIGWMKRPDIKVMSKFI
ncbi:MAG: GNAT family N-acetyltransferase [Calditrichaeota bacterium]|nr:MAG: GNAT family N-acetyltransferase [Calditrichota bacterium]